MFSNSTMSLTELVVGSTGSLTGADCLEIAGAGSITMSSLGGTGIVGLARAAKKDAGIKALEVAMILDGEACIGATIAGGS